MSAPTSSDDAQLIDPKGGEALGRPALGMDAAMMELTHHAGVLYDQDVVEACLSVVRSGFDFDSDSEAS